MGVVTGPDESTAPTRPESAPNESAPDEPTPNEPTPNINGRPLIPGEATGPLLSLTHPISFWGGVDPVEGRIVDPRHPQVEASIVGTVLAIPSAVGSSSSSAIMLELIREGRAPAAILLGKADAILALGVVVATELGYAPVPVIEVPPEQLERLERLPDGAAVTVGKDGSVTVAAD
jgi:predicted aconitase with swiveling domain